MITPKKPRMSKYERQKLLNKKLGLPEPIEPKKSYARYSLARLRGLKKGPPKK